MHHCRDKGWNCGHVGHFVGQIVVAPLLAGHLYELVVKVLFVQCTLVMLEDLNDPYTAVIVPCM